MLEINDHENVHVHIKKSVFSEMYICTNIRYFLKWQDIELYSYFNLHLYTVVTGMVALPKIECHKSKHNATIIGNISEKLQQMIDML